MNLVIMCLSGDLVLFNLLKFALASSIQIFHFHLQVWEVFCHLLFKQGFCLFLFLYPFLHFHYTPIMCILIYFMLSQDLCRLCHQFPLVFLFVLLICSAFQFADSFLCFIKSVVKILYGIDQFSRCVLQRQSSYLVLFYGFYLLVELSSCSWAILWIYFSYISMHSFNSMCLFKMLIWN